VGTPGLVNENPLGAIGKKHAFTLDFLMKETKPEAAGAFSRLHGESLLVNKVNTEKGKLKTE
jgi:hypothetical protein